MDELTTIFDNQYNSSIIMVEFQQQYPRKILIIYINQPMKKYVSKEDVEKGLVDPTKPLTEQKDYLQKIEKEQRQKNPNKDKQKDKSEHQNNKRKQRQNRVKYNWNRRDVVESTPVPDAPKKQVPKPDKNKFFEQLDAFKKQIEQLNKKKSDLIHQLGVTIRNKSDTRKNTNNIKSKYSAVLNQKHNIKKGLHDQVRLLEQKRNQIDRQFKQVVQKIKALRKPESFENCSSQQLQRKLEKTENKLTTADISKKQQNLINMKIAEIKRALQRSRSDVQINSQIQKLEDHKQIIDKQYKQIKDEISIKKDELFDIKKEIAAINQDLGKEKKQPEDARTIEQLRAQCDKKIEDITQQKNKIKQKIDKLRQKFDKDQDEYEDYYDLVSYIKMVNEQKQKIKKWKQEQERIKKQKQQRQKQRLKQIEQRQKKRLEKQQKEQQRRKQAQERRQKLQKEREQFINRNPHHEKLQLCQSLIDYCLSLKPENALKMAEKREEKVVQPMLQLKPSDSKDWQKQLKKGAQIIAPKKLREEQEAPKKVVKQKKKKQQPDNVVSGFAHHIQMSRMFEKINILPPLTAAEIDQTIKQINDRVELFNKPSEQQKAAFKQKAEKQFDDMHGTGNYDNNDRGRKGGHHQYKEKNAGDTPVASQQTHQNRDKQTKQKPRAKKMESNQVVANEKEFPGLN